MLKCSSSIVREFWLARAKTLEEMRAKFQEFKVTDEDNVQFVCDHSIVEKFGRLYFVKSVTCANHAFICLRMRM